MASDHDAHHPSAHRVGPTKRVSPAAVILDASNDEEALAEAHRIVDRIGIEGRDRARPFLATPPADTRAAPADTALSPAGEAAT